MLLIGLLIALLVFNVGASVDEQAPSTTGTGKATLTITDLRPLAVSGRGFEANERVVVSTGSARKTVTANAAGRFVVRLGWLRCAAGPIRAVGDKGSRAVTRPPKILCVQP